MIKSLVQRILPNSIIKVLINLKLIFSLLVQYIYDFSVYRRFNGAKINLNSSQIEGKIIAHYHVLEKGISHPTPKKCFSLLVVANLIKLINKYEPRIDLLNIKIFNDNKYAMNNNKVDIIITYAIPTFDGTFSVSFPIERIR